ncbi:MAG: hypothetical protein RDU59_03440 [Thermodesulfobacteriota bacterium]|nr:hypothetical protein [Thermodesulfobacteriota bacterium]
MITIGLSAHRAEAIPFLKNVFARSDVIILEEPPHPSFQTMLEGEIPIPGYLEQTDPSFPIYSGQIYHLLQDCYRRGKLVTQIEPYLAKLNEIHESVEKGLKPADLTHQPETKAVYDAENMTFGALLNYYQSVDKTFAETTWAVMDFASRDAQRIKLRDQMRAEAITDFIRENRFQDKTIYIEAGYIHFALRAALLKIKNAHQHNVKQVFILAEPSRNLSYKQGGRAVDFISPPGDLLTLHYMFRGKFNEALGKLLAARSLIYVSLLTKEELFPTQEQPTPHLAEEVRLKAFVDKLDYKACETIFSRIKNLPTAEAQKMLRLL